MERLKLQRRHGRATSPKGQQRVVQILEAARHIIVTEGYAALSMRKIASACGISVGNLVYYYGGKEALMHDLCEAVIEGYLTRLNSLTKDPALSPADRFVRTVECLVRDLNTKETTRFFIDLWSQSNHDKVAKRTLDSIYEAEQRVFAQLIRDVNPDISSERLNTLALFMTATVEGHLLFLGYRRGHAAATTDILAIFRQSFLDLAAREP